MPSSGSLRSRQCDAPSCGGRIVYLVPAGTENPSIAFSEFMLRNGWRLVDSINLDDPSSKWICDECGKKADEVATSWLNKGESNEPDNH